MTERETCGNPECGEPFPAPTVEDCLACVKNDDRAGCGMRHILKNILERLETLENQ